MMQLYDITIAANTTRQLDAPGSYFYFYTGSAGGADSTITLRGLSSGLRITLKPGQAFRLPAGQSETSWVLTNSANVATIIGSVIVGDGDITDNRVTGSVEVIDGGKNRTNADSAFLAYGSQVAGTNIAHVQLWNPVGSGKNLMVSQISVSSPTAAIPQFGTNTTALATLGTNPRSKKNMVTPSVAQMRMQAAATALETSAMAFMLPNNQAYKFAEPITITPGYGLVIRQNTNNYDLVAGLEFYEEAV